MGLGYETEFPFDDDSTEDDRNREYLRQRPAMEMSMWMDWVQTICRHRKIAPPTGREWDSLTATFHHGKMPLTSVDELEAMRKQPNTPINGERSESAA